MAVNVQDELFPSCYNCLVVRPSQQETPHVKWEHDKSYILQIYCAGVTMFSTNRNICVFFPFFVTFL